MIYLIMTAVAIVSPVLAIAEPIAVIGGLSSKVSWWLLAICLASGQCIGFTIFYFFGQRIIARWQWLARKFERVSLDEYAHRRNLFTFLAAAFGMPPATALALAGPLYEPRFRVLISITFFGRLSRFLVVAGAATIFVDYVDLSQLPTWLRPYF
jgi:membrane protein YqaA with SNARE-associated domain